MESESDYFDLQTAVSLIPVYGAEPTLSKKDIHKTHATDSLIPVGHLWIAASRWDTTYRTAIP